jgi:hypothetical protein
MMGKVQRLAQAMRMCKLYVLVTAKAHPRLKTGGGLRRTWVGGS